MAVRGKERFHCKMSVLFGLHAVSGTDPMCRTSYGARAGGRAGFGWHWKHRLREQSTVTMEVGGGAPDSDSIHKSVLLRALPPRRGLLEMGCWDALPWLNVGGRIWVTALKAHFVALALHDLALRTLVALPSHFCTSVTFVAFPSYFLALPSHVASTNPRMITPLHPKWRYADSNAQTWCHGHVVPGS